MKNPIKRALAISTFSLASLLAGCSNYQSSIDKEVQKINLRTLAPEESKALEEFHKYPYSGLFIKYAQELLRTDRIDFTDKEAVYVRREIEKRELNPKDLSPILYQRN